MSLMTALKQGLQQKLDEMLPVTTQLGSFERGEALESGFLI